MYKATLSLAILAIAKLALAQPYCLITAVNKFEHPADQETLCTKEAKKVESYLEELCPSDYLDAAKQAFKDACDDASYDTKDDSSSSSSVSGKHTKSGSEHKSAYYPVVYTTTYYDEECTCTKTTAVSSTYAAGSTGFATGTAAVATGTSPASPGGAGAGGSGAAATGSPIAPAVEPTASSNKFTGAASQNVVSGAGALFALGALVIML